MTDNEARAQELAEMLGLRVRRPRGVYLTPDVICEHDVSALKSALDAVGRRERIAGLTEASAIAAREYPMPSDEPAVTLGAVTQASATRSAIAARITALEGVTDAASK